MVIIQQKTQSSSATCQRGHVEKVEDPCYVLAKYWNLLSKYNNFRFFLLQNMATLDHFSSKTSLKDLHSLFSFFSFCVTWKWRHKKFTQKSWNLLSRFIYFWALKILQLWVFFQNKFVCKICTAIFFFPLLCQMEVVKICPKKAGISFLDYYHFLALKIQQQLWAFFQKTNSFVRYMHSLFFFCVT